MDIAKFLGIYIPQKRGPITTTTTTQSPRIANVLVKRPGGANSSANLMKLKMDDIPIYPREKLLVGQNIIPPHYFMFGFFAFLVTAGVISHVYDSSTVTK